MKVRKKVWSILLTLSMLCSMQMPAAASEARDASLEDASLLVHYEFQDGGEDSSGNGNDAVIGEGVTVQDGVASLPGGTKDSSAYITLPTGMFDRQDELTISMWLKDLDPRESWLGAFFFGSPANANHVPPNYYYFVPCEKDAETLKSVFTDSVNETSPNSTEKGVAKSVKTAEYFGIWTHYAIVLQPGSMTCYINGQEVGEASLSRRVSDFGTGLESYIGKSNYLSDPIYEGDFRDFRVYTDVLGADQIEEVMLDGMEPSQLLEMAAQDLTIPGLVNNATSSHLTLPSKTFFDRVDVSWTSSDETIMDSTGQIQDIREEQTVELTATLSYEGAVKTRTFRIQVWPIGSVPYSMHIDGDHVTKQLSENLYGLFYEDINSAADGGLYPEMVKNYSFENAHVEAGDTSSSYFKENGYRTVADYDLHWEVAPSASFTVRSQGSLNENNTHYARISGNATMTNGGFAPMSDPNGAAMAVKPVNQEERTGTYTFSVYAKADSGYPGNLRVKLTDAQGHAITDEQTISLDADGTWKKVSAQLTSTVSQNTKGKLVLTIEGAEANDALCLDMVSVVPHDSYGYGNKNYAYGVGIRKDLLDLMMDLNPKFMRFPGGCIVEGFNWEGYYDWRDSIGPLEERKANTNRWENWGPKDHSWGYMQSYGFGYHEMLTLCEDYGMEAFPILNAGLLCQYETKNVDAKTGEELQEFIDMATDLLDYCWGDADANEWAKKRAENGHPEPFDLKYLGIGNENFQAKYFDNLDVIKEAVEDYAAEHYPDRELNIISSAGPTSDGADLEYAYDRLAQTMPGETLVDEHYYQSESFMYNQSDRYDYYQRTDQGGSDVFVGEYAVKNDNKYNTALAEAAYITGLERNADVVKHISYAPLLYKVGNQCWAHDLIYFDEFDTAKSTNYYVQQMFGQNYGTELIGTELKAAGKDYSNYGSPIIGTSDSEGYIDKVTIYGENGEVLLEDDFNDLSGGWERFQTGLDSSAGCQFEVRDGKLYFTGTSGVNLLYLPQAVEEKWSNYRIEVEGAVKTFGSNGFIVGAGYENQYYWYHMGKDGNNGTYMEVTRPNRGESSLTRKVLGNNFANKRYNQGQLVKIQNQDPMDITFNFGVDGKLEGSYTSQAIAAKDTGKYDFSSDLNQYQTDIYQVVNKDDSYVYVKLVNPDGNAKDMQLTFENLDIAQDASAEITMLTGDLNTANAIGNEVIVPEESSQKIVDNQLIYQLPGYSVNVIRIPLAKGQADKGQLSDLVQEARERKEADYTAQSWEVFEEALEKAERVLADEHAAQADVDEAFRALQEAMDALTPVSITETVTVKYQAGQGGRIGGMTVQTIAKGGTTLQVVAVPEEGYEFLRWDDGKTQAARTDQNVTEDKTYTALFSKKQVQEPADDEKNQPAVPVSVKLSQKKVKMGVREKVQLTAAVSPAGASQKVTWKSSKKSVVSVSRNGKLTAKKAGKALITATTENGKTVRCQVTVKKAPKKIIPKVKTKTLKRGKTFQIKTSLLPKNAASYKLRFTSSKKAVASVSANGKVKARKKGRAVITVRTYNGKKAKIQIQVK